MQGTRTSTLIGVLMSDLPGSFTRTQINQALEALGLDPGVVESITITAERVSVTTAYAVTDAGTSTWPKQRGETIIPVQFGKEA